MATDMNNDLFNDFILTVDEMKCVRGGTDDDNPPKPLNPPVVI